MNVNELAFLQSWAKLSHVWSRLLRPPRHQAGILLMSTKYAGQSAFRKGQRFFLRQPMSQLLLNTKRTLFSAISVGSLSFPLFLVGKETLAVCVGLPKFPPRKVKFQTSTKQKRDKVNCKSDRKSAFFMLTCGKVTVFCGAQKSQHNHQKTQCQT